MRTGYLSLLIMGGAFILGAACGRWRASTKELGQSRTRAAFSAPNRKYLSQLMFVGCALVALGALGIVLSW